MEDVSLIGKCGLYCGACSIFRAERDDKDWRGRIAARYNCSIEQVRCNGCGNLSTDCWGNNCRIATCTRAKGISFCFECPEYKDGKCEKFRRLACDYLEDGVDLRDNLKQIQDGRAEEWLQKSKERFSCKSCGKPLCVWNKKCHHCGADVNG